MDPLITNMSMPASTTDLKCFTTALGESDAAATAPADLICFMRSLISSGFIGAA